MLCLSQNEQVDQESNCDSHHNVEEVSSSQDYTQFAYLVGDDL